jgi:hypothetical protein
MISLLKAANDQAFLAVIPRRIVIGGADRGGIEEGHERRKAPRCAIVRRGRQQDQRVGAAGEFLDQARPPQLALLSGARRDVVTLIDDDNVPPGVLEVVAIFEVVLQGVDGDDAAVEVFVRVWLLGIRWRTRVSPPESRRSI